MASQSHPRVATSATPGAVAWDPDEVPPQEGRVICGGVIWTFSPLSTSGGDPLSPYKISEVHTDFKPSGQPREGSNYRHPPQTRTVRVRAPFKDNTETAAFILLPPHTCSRPARQGCRPRCCRAGAAAGSPCAEAAPCPPSLKVKEAEGNRRRKAKAHLGCPARTALPPLPRSCLGMLPTRCHPTRR